MRKRQTFFEINSQFLNDIIKQNIPTNLTSIKKEELLKIWGNGDIKLESQFENESCRYEHIQRIAFFCSKGWNDAPKLAIKNGKIIIKDGIHRLLAAKLLEHSIVTVELEQTNEETEDPNLLSLKFKPTLMPFFPTPMAYMVNPYKQ